MRTACRRAGAGGGGDRRRRPRSSTTTSTTTGASCAPTRAATPSARVRRTGCSWPSACDDEERFRAIWSWTATHLQRDDGLLAWRWADGAVVDPAPAADADLIAAGALVLAGRRFGDPALVADGREISAAVLAHETVVRRRTPRARSPGRGRPAEGVVNPSYFVLGLMSVLYDAGEAGWQPVAATSRRLLDAATAAPPGLVPDWATVAADGGLDDGAGRRRAVIRSSPASRPGGPTSSSPSTAVAGRSWRPGRGRSSPPSPPTAGRSTPRTPSTGRRTRRRRTRWRSSRPRRPPPRRVTGRPPPSCSTGRRSSTTQQPTYYGAAWLAIARLWLDTDRLGGCRPADSLTGSRRRVGAADRAPDWTTWIAVEEVRRAIGGAIFERIAGPQGAGGAGAAACRRRRRALVPGRQPDRPRPRRRVDVHRRAERPAAAVAAPAGDGGRRRALRVPRRPVGPARPHVAVPRRDDVRDGRRRPAPDRRRAGRAPPRRRASPRTAGRTRRRIRTCCRGSTSARSTRSCARSSATGRAR